VALPPSRTRSYYRAVKFSCDRCGQRYVSPDEPKAEQSYRILCIVCGATVRLKGGEFPALPTFASDPAPAPGTSPEAAAEEPVAIALAPMAQREPPAAARQHALPGEAPRREARVRRWWPLVGGSVVALATIGAGVLLFSGGPGSEPPDEATVGRSALETTPDLAGKAPAPDSAGSPAVRPGVAAAPPPRGQSQSAAVAPAAAKQGLGQSDEATPARSAQPAPIPRPPGPATASSPKTSSSAAHGAPPASRPGAATPEHTAAAAPNAPEATTVNSARPSPEAVAAAVAARRPAFDSCLQEATRSEPGLMAAGRTIAVIATVNPIGVVTSPRIEEPMLQDTELGECLRSAARKLLFPAFTGEPFQVRIPVVLGK
jgi:hypothetical protein